MYVPYLKTYVTDSLLRYAMTGVPHWRWRWKDRFDGKEKLMPLGAYPDIPLANARKHHADARRQLADGVDPTFATPATQDGSIPFLAAAAAMEVLLPDTRA